MAYDWISGAIQNATAEVQKSHASSEAHLMQVIYAVGHRNPNCLSTFFS